VEGGLYMILHDLRESLPDYRIKEITKDDYDDLYNLELLNIDYYMCTHGRAVTYEESIKDTIDLPPNTTYDQKFYIGFFSNDKLVAVMDYIEHYPTKDIIWIGFFMIDVNVKRKKIGTKIITEFINVLEKNNIQKLQLGCVDSNNVALRFWKSFGMNEIRRVVTKDDSRPDWNVIVFEKNILRENIVMKNIDILIKEYTNLLNDKKEKCKTKCNELTNDNRKDEADLEKIKLNIYDVFTTLVGATKKQILAKKDIDESLKYETFCNAYLQTFDKIPQSWRVKLEKAKENNAVIDIVIEESKLSVASELKSIFTNLM